MSTWRIDRHYGYGAGKVRIQGEGHRGTEAALRDGIATLLGEWVEGGPLGAVRRIAGEAPGILLGLILVAAVTYTILQDHTDNSAIEVVMFDGALPLPEPDELLAEPLIEPVVEPETEVVPPPVEVVEAKPEPAPEPVAPTVIPKPPPPPALAERPKPPPPPPVAKPRPVPIVPKLAAVAPPKPPAAVRPERSVRDRAALLERPKVEISQVAPAPIRPTPKIERMARAVVPPPTLPKNTPRLATPAAPDLARPEAPMPKRAFRVAAAQPAAGQRPRALAGLAPAPVEKSTSRNPTRTTRERQVAPRPAPSQGPRVVTPALAVAAVPGPPAPSMPAPARKARANPLVEERSPRLPDALGPQSLPKATATVPKLANRAGRTSGAPIRNVASAENRPGVAGVPLGDLAACVSDRDEDRLKQAIVAAVKTQEECVSSKGTYRFVETKNLNAFLMWIDRTPSRAVEDRCAELRYALECLQSDSRRAAR